MSQVKWTDLKAIIVDPSGPELTAEERELFTREKPAGFILFKRNCVSREQVKKLVADLRACVGKPDLPILIDQEGGSVARLKSPAFTEYPSAKVFGDLYRTDKKAGMEATEANSYLMARDLADMGITVNCAPVADVPSPDCHEFLSGSRTYDESPEGVAELGDAVCRGLLSGGVSPVIKHIPGHGRAKVDSHLALPVVDAKKADLAAVDFKPFKTLSQSNMKTALWAMAAHVVYSDIDPDSPATVSAHVTEKVIRGDIGFDGVLIADDISMKALGGSIEERVAKTLGAGMDLTMICNASFEDRRAALAACPKVTVAAADRLQKAEDQRVQLAKPDNDNTHKTAVAANLSRLMGNNKRI